MKDRFETLERLFNNKKFALLAINSPFNSSTDQQGAIEVLRLYYNELIEMEIKRLVEEDSNGKDVDSQSDTAGRLMAKCVTANQSH